ncbi:MAG TPA: hypothetical protein VNZ52_09540 [Candidatus Thermoplasmatota archaeon]|nr:hypothetical protein [Candidatus Thermoplasmatota archaeon]
MMLPAHLAATVLLGLVLARFMPMDTKAWLLALAFGVVIDLDHLIAVPRYLMTHPGGALDVSAALQWGAEWQGFMHTPWAILVVVAALVLTRSPIPLLFWALHMFQDFVVAKYWVRWGSPLEWLVTAGLVAAIGMLLYWEHRTAHQQAASFGGYLRSRATVTVAALQTVMPGRRR